MKFISLILFFTSGVVFSSDTDVIYLNKSQHFNTKKCQIIQSARISDLSKVNEFKMDNNDYLSVILLGKNSIECYSFKYYPDLSPYLHFRVKKNNLYILEMSGSAMNENWFEKKYIINIKEMSLTENRK